MKDKVITEIQSGMLTFLDNGQMEQLKKVLVHCLHGLDMVENASISEEKQAEENARVLKLFIFAKRVEGCSEKSLKYYENTIYAILASVMKMIKHITTDDLRNYLGKYQQDRPANERAGHSNCIH